MLRLLRILALVAPVGASWAADPAFNVSAGCRDGAPNGGYELRTRDGQLRVAGAFHEGRRTGTFLFWNSSGARLAAVPYDEGVRNGTIALWFVAGRPARTAGRKAETRVVSGALHGARFAWHSNGERRSQAEYERGRLVAAAAWDARGRPLAAEAARTAVEAEVAEDEAFLERLERFVADHEPPCG